MTFEEAKKSIRWILTVSHPIGSWELENIMDALDITPCDISTCKVAKALWGNKGNIPDIDISRVKNGTPLEAQTTDEVKCDYTTEEIAKAFIEDVEAVKDQLDGQPRWIPVSERLPDDRQRCIVTVQGDSKTFIDIVTYYAEEHSFLYYEECNVLAWMPLPEPYREGDNDAEH